MFGVNRTTSDRLPFPCWFQEWLSDTQQELLSTCSSSRAVEGGEIQAPGD